MDVRRTGWLLLCAALLLAGCRRQQFVTSYIETINNTNRELEDEVDRLEYELEVLKQTNEDLKKQNEKNRDGRRSGSSSDSGSGSSGPRLLGPGRRPPAMTPDDDHKPPSIVIPMEPATPAEPTPPAEPMTLRPEPPAQPRAIDPPATKLEKPVAPVAPTPRRSGFPAPEPAPEPEPADELPVPEKRVRTPPPTGNERTPTAIVRPLPPIVAPSQARPAVIDSPPVPPAEELSPSQPTATEGAPRSTPDAAVAPAQGPATKIHLNPLHTGGQDVDGQPGDEGVSLLLEPQNSAGDFMPVVGKITVAVLDPQLTGDAARVAKWEFDEPAVRKALKTISTRRGIQLQMNWTDNRPQNHRLRLYVRLETPEGAKLQTDREIFVTLPGEVSDRWTPRKGEAANIARQPSAMIVEPKVAPAAPAVVTTPPVVEKAPLPSPASTVQPPSEPAIVEPQSTAVAAPDPTPAAAPLPTRATSRPKSKLIAPPPSLGDSP